MRPGLGTLVLILVAGCFSPVDPDAPVLSWCFRDCPLGACGEVCASTPRPDASTAAPTSVVCFASNVSCAPYTSRAFSTDAPPSGASGGSYCFTTTDPAPRTIGVAAADAGAKVFDCTAPDAGAPCPTLCPRRKHYTVTGGGFDGG